MPLAPRGPSAADTIPRMPPSPSASRFLTALKAQAAPPRGAPQPSSGRHADGEPSIGVRMGVVFALAKANMAMPIVEIEKMLDSPLHEMRVGAVAIMDWQARSNKTPAQQRQRLFELYIRRHDRINTWDLVDRSAPYVVGGYLSDKPRRVLYRLARSKNPWERRTAIVATYYFIRQNDLDDTFHLAELLLHDPDESVQKAVGGWIREAGKRDLPRLLKFLDRHAAGMPRPMLRYSIEHLPKSKREHYMGLKNRSAH